MVDDVSQTLFVVHNRSGTLKDFYSTLQFFPFLQIRESTFYIVAHYGQRTLNDLLWARKKIGFHVKSFVIPSLQFLCPYCKSFLVFLKNHLFLSVLSQDNYSNGEEMKLVTSLLTFLLGHC